MVNAPALKKKIPSAASVAGKPRTPPRQDGRQPGRKKQRYGIFGPRPVARRVQQDAHEARAR